MIRVYRVLPRRYARTAFDGEGAYRFGGRWSSPGVRLVYASEHESLALLEYFVHLDSEDAPADLVLATADVPDEVSRGQIASGSLPVGWRSPVAPAALAEIGDRFVRERKSCALLVPSVLAPSECNWMLNPAHTEFARIEIRAPEPTAFDRRMIEGRRRR